MGIKLHQEPKLEKPCLVASWPGIGNIGLIAVDTLRAQLQAEELGEIEPWDFFYPRKVTIKGGVLEKMEFPGCRFYYKRLGGKDLIFFIGEEQPTYGGGVYAEGEKAYQMANLVLDVAQRFGCPRVYTSGAAVAPTHHALRPRVWAVTSRDSLNQAVKSYENTILMAELESGGERGGISGLNGLLLGVAKKRGFEAISLMGEIPDYLARAPFPYPRASKSVLEVLTRMLGVQIDYHPLDEMTERVDGIIADLHEQLPPEVRERIEQRRLIVQAKPDTITEEDERWLKAHIEELFRKRGGGERPA